MKGLSPRRPVARISGVLIPGPPCDFAGAGRTATPAAKAVSPSSNCSSPAKRRTRYNQPFASASFAASDRFLQPNFWIAFER